MIIFEVEVTIIN